MYGVSAVKNNPNINYLSFVLIIMSSHCMRPDPYLEKCILFLHFLPFCLSIKKKIDWNSQGVRIEWLEKKQNMSALKML